MQNYPSGDCRILSNNRHQMSQQSLRPEKSQTHVCSSSPFLEDVRVKEFIGTGSFLDQRNEYLERNVKRQVVKDDFQTLWVIWEVLGYHLSTFQRNNFGLGRVTSHRIVGGYFQLEFPKVFFTLPERNIQLIHCNLKGMKGQAERSVATGKHRRDLGFSAKYCHGLYVFPLSLDRSRAHTAGRGELAIWTATYATWNSWN